MKNILMSSINALNGYFSSTFGFNRRENIKLHYLGKNVAPQQVNKLSDIWSNISTTLPTFLPVTNTTNGLPNTIMHEMILGRHDRFRHFIDLLFENDPNGANRYTLFLTYIYGGEHLSGNDVDLSVNRPIELAVNAMLNSRFPQEERIDIRRNIGYLLTLFINYVQENEHENCPTLLSKLQRFINGINDKYLVSNYDRCLYHITSIWVDTQRENFTRNLRFLKFNTAERTLFNSSNFLSLLADSDKQDEKDLYHELLPEVCRSYAGQRRMRWFDEDYYIRNFIWDCIKQNNLLRINEILENEAVKINAYIPNPDQYTTLNLAIELRHIEVLTMLLNKVPLYSYAADQVYWPALYQASDIGNTEIVLILLKYLPEDCASIQFRYKTAIAQAAYADHSEVIKALLDPQHLGDMSAYDMYKALLNHAALSGREKVIKTLLEVDIIKDNAHAGNNAALKMAVQGGCQSSIDHFLRIESVRKDPYGAKIYQQRKTELANAPLNVTAQQVGDPAAISDIMSSNVPHDQYENHAENTLIASNK